MSQKPANTDFLSAKLHPQRVTQDLVGRQSLINELQKFHCHPKLSLLIAPAGYGKSTLLCQLMAEREAASEVVAWLSLDNNDNTPSVFATYLLSSFSASMINYLPHNTDLIEGSQNANPKEKLTLLFNAAQAHGAPVTVILDDFHVLKNDKLLRLVDWILQSMPSNLSFVIGSREKPKLTTLAELKAKSNLVEIDGGRMVFSLDESRQFFASIVNDEPIDDDLLTILHEKTEGWVAALQLVQLALRNHSDPATFVKDFSGTDRDIVSYLGGCVISQLAPDTKDFMLRTSVLDRMNGELCAELTGHESATTELVSLKRAGLFVFAIDRENYWYRYHHLFGDFLRAELKAKNSKLYYQLCMQAAAWFEKSGRIDEAVGYYLDAKSYDLASDLIAQRASMVVQYQGQHETLLNWLKRLPVEYINQNPQILVSYLWSLNFMRYFNRYTPVLEEFRNSQPPEQDSEYLQYNLEMLDCMRDVLSGRQLSAKDKCVNWLDRWKNAPQFERGCVLASLSANVLHTLEFKLARRVILEASHEFYQCESEYGVAWAGAIQSLVSLRQGFTQEAKDTVQKSLIRSNKLLGEFSFTSAMLSLSLGNVYYDMNELDEAAKLIDKGFLYIEEHGLPDTTIAGFTTKARILQSQQDTIGAIEVLKSGERFGREQNIINFEFALTLERGRILILNKMLDPALAIRDDIYDTESDELLVALTPYEKLLFEFYKIRLDIALGRFEQVLKPVSLLISSSKQKKCHSLELLGLILQASVLAKDNQILKAMRAIQKAISMAAPQNNLRIFIDEQEHIVELLPSLIKSYQLQEPSNKASSNSHSHFVKNLIESISNDEVSEVNNRSRSSLKNQEPVDANEELTKRERQILDLLSTGLSNQELADALFISLATTKWHLSNVYSKLGVKNKIQAIRVFQERINDD